MDKIAKDKSVLRPYISALMYAIRNSLNYTQQEFSEVLKIDPRSYSDLELGKMLCSVPTLIRFLHHHDDPLSVILKCEDLLRKEEKTSNEI